MQDIAYSLSSTPLSLLTSCARSIISQLQQSAPPPHGVLCNQPLANVNYFADAINAISFADCKEAALTGLIAKPTSALSILLPLAAHRVAMATLSSGNVNIVDKARGLTKHPVRGGVDNSSQGLIATHGL